MDTQRPTREITTTNGHTVVLREFITGREQREIQQIFLRKVQMGKLTMDEPTINSFDASAVGEAQDKAVAFVVVSVDGNTEGVVDAVLNLQSQDTQEVIDAINEITAGKKK